MTEESKKSFEKSKTSCSDRAGTPGDLKIKSRIKRSAMSRRCRLCGSVLSVKCDIRICDDCILKMKN